MIAVHAPAMQAQAVVAHALTGPTAALPLVPHTPRALSTLVPMSTPLPTLAPTMAPATLTVMPTLTPTEVPTAAPTLVPTVSAPAPSAPAPPAIPQRLVIPAIGLDVPIVEMG